MGVGSTLKRWFGWFGIHADPRFCGCKSKAMLYDCRGPVWCQEKSEKIISALRREARRLGIPFSDHIARVVLDAAIRQESL